MALNYIWVAFFIIAFVVGLFRLIFYGDMEVFPNMVNGTFDSAKTGFEISLGLTGVLTLWMGLMKIGEMGGIIKVFSRIVGPFFSRLFPELPKDHPATGSIMMNFAANMLGLDNAATPLGLKAMKEMQETNTQKDTASNPMIMFLVLNTSGLTIIPISIMVYRAQLGAADPSDIFIPILLATFFSTVVGLISVSIYQRINLFDKVILAYIGGLTLAGSRDYLLFLRAYQKNRSIKFQPLPAILSSFPSSSFLFCLACVKKSTFTRLLSKEQRKVSVLQLRSFRSSSLYWLPLVPLGLQVHWICSSKESEAAWQQLGLIHHLLMHYQQPL